MRYINVVCNTLQDVTDQQKIREIISLFSFLQNYIQNHVDNSFTDLTADLESLIKDYLNVFEDANSQYVNLNQVKHNYPAIDLANNKKGISIQVTTNADLRKAKKTLETYKKHNLTFQQLILIGFVKSSKTNLQGISIYGIDYLTNLTNHANGTQLDQLYEILKRKIPWNSLTPLTDEHCYDIVFDVINRSAIRDYTLCEGDFDKMADGLSEVKEIITTGVIKGKSIRAKALVEYKDPVRRKLSEIELHVSQILQICNSNKNQRKSDFLCLSRQETDEIDNLKEKIIKNANLLAQDLNLNKQITGSRRY